MGKLRKNDDGTYTFVGGFSSNNKNDMKQITDEFFDFDDSKPKKKLEAEKSNETEVVKVTSSSAPISEISEEESITKDTNSDTDSELVEELEEEIKELVEKPEKETKKKKRKKKKEE